MSCLVDFYVITPKDSWLGIITVPIVHNFIRIQNAVPGKYHEMFHALLIEFHHVDQIIDTRDKKHFQKVQALAMKYETGSVRFDARGNKESLLQVIRKTFFTTIFAIRNDFNWAQHNFYCVVSSDEVMHEEIDVPETINQKGEIQWAA